MTQAEPSASSAHPRDESAREVVVDAKGVSKAFGGIKANTDIDLTVHRGDVVGIMGPNGAGKSTFLSLLAGAQKPTSGTLHVLGADMARMDRPGTARLGVGFAHQIPKPFRQLTVRENVQVAAQVAPRASRAGLVDQALELTGMTGRQHLRAGSLGLLEMKRLEVARVLGLDPKLVLLDEVAAGLNGADLDELIETIGVIRDQGKTIIVVEHVQEVFHRLAERVAVLEWGQKLMEGTPAEVSADPRVIKIYLGTQQERQAHAEGGRHDVTAAPILQLAAISSGYGPINVLHEASLDVRPGEVVAVLGANGAGKTTLAKSIQGLVRPRAGRITFAGDDVTTMPPNDRVKRGMALVPEGRRLFGPLTVSENLRMSMPRGASSEGLDRAYELFPKLKELDDRPAGLLSGGEQQMVAIGRALASNPKLIVFDELSLGLAPVVVERMLEAVDTIARWGTAVVLIEQNVHRALELADRIVVFRRGRVIYSGAPGDFTEEQLAKAYLGTEELDEPAETTQPTKPPAE